MKAINFQKGEKIDVIEFVIVADKAGMPLTHPSMFAEICHSQRL